MKLKPYDFRLGAREVIERLDARAAITWEHCCYVVRGFATDGKHRVWSGRLLRDARRTASHMMLKELPKPA